MCYKKFCMKQMKMTMSLPNSANYWNTYGSILFFSECYTGYKNIIVTALKSSDFMLPAMMGPV